jgi:multidrug resistance efflux pump
LAIRAAEQEMAVARAESEFATREWARQQSLSGARVSSDSERDRSETAEGRNRSNLQRAESELKRLQSFVRPEDEILANARVSAAEARVDVCRARVANTVLTAPTDGVVLEILKREGELVSNVIPEAVVIFGNLASLQVRAEIDETYAGLLKPGQKATIKTRGLDHLNAEGSVTSMKTIMGKKTVFARTSLERKDLDVLQVFIALPESFRVPVGLEVDVAIEESR